MRPTALVRPLAVLAVVVVLAGACSSDGSDDSQSASTTSSADTAPAEPLPIPAATLTEITADGSPWMQGTTFDLTEQGYTQTEFTLGGSARSFTSQDELTEDGRWTAVPFGEADYLTRVLVHRPADVEDFNGTLVVEWFNVSGGLDAAPDWTGTHTELMREGYAWVGVSAQQGGVEPSGRPGLDVGFPLDLKSNNPARYGDLSHPGDAFSYDIYSQAAQAVQDPSGANPLDGLDIERVLAMGESQSASRLTTYINAVDPLTQLFDGFFVHSRGGGGSELADEGDAPLPPDRVEIRDDVRVPVLTFLTETDVFGRDGTIRDQQPDSANYRLWEGAGTAHVDTYTLVQDIGPEDRGNDPSIADVVVTADPLPGIIECAEPINSGPQHWLLNAAVHELNEWVETGSAPPEAPRFEIDESSDGFALDDKGNVLGGIRSPWVDAPVAIHSGGGQTGDGFCGLFGTTTPFDDETLADLYPDHETYVAAVQTALDAALADGYIRPVDADLIFQAAKASAIGG